MLYGDLLYGTRHHHKPEKRFTYGLKESLAACYKDDPVWETDACDRYNWKRTIHKGTKILQEQVGQMCSVQL